LPEGDTIFRAARTLNRALAGAIVTGFQTQLPSLARLHEDQPLTGRTIEFVRATGKWIQMGFSGDLILLTHMLMSGSWHIYRPQESWRKSRFHMRIAIETPAIVAVAFDVQVAEFHTAASLARRRGFNQLGPDVLGNEFDHAKAVANLTAHPELETGVALLTQSIVAGLGNVYKSEVCFLAQVNPFQRVGTLSRFQLESMVSIAEKLMSSNVVAHTGMRRTTSRSDPAEGLWVYHRKGLPCRTCGATIVSRKQGEDARTSFWCPVCQPAS